MALALFLDFAQTSPSRKLSQTRADPPSGLHSIPREFTGLAERQGQRHSALGSSLGSEYPLLSQLTRRDNVDF